MNFNQKACSKLTLKEIKSKNDWFIFYYQNKKFFLSSLIFRINENIWCFSFKSFEKSVWKFQINVLTSSIVIDDKIEWKVDDILDARKHYRRVQFLIKWKEHDENKILYNSKKFRNETENVKNFYVKYSNKSRFDWLKNELNQKIWESFKKNSVTNISFVFKSERVNVISRYREIVLSKDRRHFVSSKDFRIIEMWWDVEVIKKIEHDECSMWWKENVLIYKYLSGLFILFLFFYFFST